MMKFRMNKLALIAFVGMFAQQQVMADVLPGPALPEQVSKSLRNTQVSQEGTAVAPPLVRPKQEQESPLGPQAKKIKFQLNGVILEGNTVYSDSELAKLYRDKLHKTISVADLFDIVQSITNYYRNNGYIISRAILPPQHVKNGVVKIRIIEGYIGQVDVTGNPYGARCLVKAFAEKIRQCPPLKLARMEKYLLLANEIPATEVKAVLSPSKTQTGAADLTLVTQNRPITGYFSYDNYGTRYIGPQQMTANVGFNSALTSGDSTQLTYTKTTKGQELTYLDANYSAALNAEGVRWLLGATNAKTHPLFVLAPADINGSNNNYYTTVTYPIIRTRSKNLTLRTGFNYQDSHVTTLDSTLYTDHIRSIDLGGTFNWADSWYGSNMLTADFRQGLPIFDYTSDTSIFAQTSRPGGHAVYSKIAASYSRLQAIKGPISLYFLATGQYGFQALLAAEQFTFGGPQIGRGYDVAELIGDKGLAGSLELRYDLGVNLFKLQALQIYGYYEGGVVWNYLFVGGTPTKQSATTAGFGTRFYFTQHLSGNIMWTQVLTKQIAAEQLIGDGRRPRVFFSVVWSMD